MLLYLLWAWVDFHITLAMELTLVMREVLSWKELVVSEDALPEGAPLRRGEHAVVSPPEVLSGVSAGEE